MEKQVKLRLLLRNQVIAKLYAGAWNKEGRFLQIRRVDGSNPEVGEVDLIIDGSVELNEVGELFDLLGVFQKSNLTKVERLKELLLETYELAEDITHEVQTPGSLPPQSPEWRISMGLGELRTALEGIAEWFGFKPFFMK